MNNQLLARCALRHATKRHAKELMRRSRGVFEYWMPEFCKRGPTISCLKSDDVSSTTIQQALVQQGVSPQSSRFLSLSIFCSSCKTTCSFSAASRMFAATARARG